MNNKTIGLRLILDGLISRYVQRVPEVLHIINAMVEEGIITAEDDIQNDHIAFRTLGVPNLGVKSLEKIFLHFGYTKKDHYYFSEKALDAWWYAPPSKEFPRIFISELRVADLSARSEAIIRAYTGSIKKDPVDMLDINDPVAVDLFLHSSLWRIPTLADYESLASESEYAAWVIFNRYYLNHFTIAVHNLKEGYNTIEAFNDFLQRKGIILNDAGGIIKQSPDGALLQSSTVAHMVEATFAYGKKGLIPGSYVEFAERRVLDTYSHLPMDQITDEHRREGFEVGNADKIFESTYLEQTGRR